MIFQSSIEPGIFLYAINFFDPLSLLAIVKELISSEPECLKRIQLLKLNGNR